MTTKNDDEAFSMDNLKKIPFLNDKRSQAIVDYIAAHGKPESREDFMKIPNIGTELAGQLYDHFNGGSDSSQQAAG